jgi:hypothetical protein
MRGDPPQNSRNQEGDEMAIQIAVRELILVRAAHSTIDPRDVANQSPQRIPFFGYVTRRSNKDPQRTWDLKYFCHISRSNSQFSSPK